MLVLIMLGAALVACGDKGNNDPAESGSGSENTETNGGDTSGGEVDRTIELSGTTYPINNTATWLKRLDPRMEANESYLTCDWSASGIEFAATFSGDLYFEVKVNAKKGGGVEGCYFRAYVDGVEYKNGNGSPYYEAIPDSETKKTYIVLRDIPEGTHTVKLLKATGYTLANVNLISLNIVGTLSDTAPANNELLIEFVGDSISCGWGVVGKYDGAYTAQDATLAYPYLISSALNTDYSVVALSGQGVIKGNPGIGKGYKYASPFRSTSEEYGFERRADFIIINADTNDAYDNFAEEQYKTALDSLVKYVREKNGADAHIILVCNMMQCTYSELIRLYVKELGGSENNYYYFKANTAAGVNSAHPTAEEQQLYATELGGMIGKIIEGNFSQNLDIVYPENYEIAYSQDFDSVSTPAEGGIGSLYGGGMFNGMTVTDGVLEVPSTSWGSGTNCFATLISNDAMKNLPEKYIIEMDLSISSLHVLGIVFNSENGGLKWGEQRRNSHFVSLRNGSQNAGVFPKGAVSAENDLVFRVGYFDDIDQKFLVDKPAYDIPEGATTADLKLSIMVNGNRVDLFVDGAWVYGYDVTNGVDLSLKKKSSVILWAEETEFTIDNLAIIVESDEEPVSPTVYKLNNTANFLKKLDPRMEATASSITCDWSASGIEFVADCRGTVEFKVNANAKAYTVNGESVKGCYFKVYVDGKEYRTGGSPYYAVDGEGTITVKGIPDGTHTIKLVKATGYTLANADLLSVSLVGSVVDTAPANKELFIEYVGDSMSCGWGVIGDHNGAYTSQDATLAFPYLISEKLGADYSIIGLSGQGLIYNTTGMPNITNGYKYASPLRSTGTEYGFERKADVIVINADTNDGYQNTYYATYIQALKSFINYARQKNGSDTHIVIVCNMMLSNYTEDIRDLVVELGGAENKYYYYKAKTCQGLYSGHPSSTENSAYADELSEMIKNILDGKYVEPSLSDPALPTGFITIYEQNFNSASTSADAGISQLYGGSLSSNMTITNGVLNVPKTSWGKPDVFATLIGNNVMKNARQRYLLEADLTVSELGVLGFILNTNGTDDRYTNQDSAILVTLRRGDYTSGAISGSTNVNLRAGYFNAGGNTQTTPTANDRLLYNVADGETSASFKMSILVDGHRVDFFIDGVWIHGYDIPDKIACQLKADSTIVLWAQDAVATIDNLKLSVDESSAEAVNNKKIPTGTTVYEQNFDNVSNPAAGGVSSLYGGSLATSVSDGKLSVGETSWNDGVFVELIGKDKLSGVGDKYIIEMDLSISKIGVFGLILNSDNDSKKHLTNADLTSDRQNGYLISLRGSTNPNDGGFTGGNISAENDIYFRTGYFDASGNQNAINKIFAYDTDGDTASFKLTVVVREGRVDLFIDGEWVYGCNAPASIDSGIKENSNVILWAQESVATIDNIKLSSFN